MSIASLVQHPGQFLGARSLVGERTPVQGADIPVHPLDIPFTTRPGGVYLVSFTIGVLLHGLHARNFRVICAGDEVAKTLVSASGAGTSDYLFDLSATLTGLWIERNPTPRSVTAALVTNQVAGDGDWRMPNQQHVSYVVEVGG